MMKWKDITSYSRSDKNRFPTTWQFKGKWLNIVITSGHIYYKGEWIMHCSSLNMNCIELGVDSKKEAEKKAIKIVMERLKEMSDEISGNVPVV